MKSKKISIILWILAVVVTLLSAIYQRMTGPTYPVRGSFTIAGETIKYKLLRSHDTGENYTIQISNPDDTLSGTLFFKRYPTNDPWTEQEMKQGEGVLTASLPYQLPGGKVAYKIVISDKNKEITIPDEEPIILRFKGEVPAFILIPHVIIIFAAMLLSNRSGLEALRKKPNLRNYVLWTVILLFLGGMILGPIMQKYAFGVFWSGFPLGEDLTDTKTLIAMIAWFIALIAIRKKRMARFFVLGAAVITLAIFFIPHSLRGTELDYSRLNQHSQ